MAHNKSPAEKIKENAAAATDPQALSMAAETTAPEISAPAKGDSKAPYREDFTAVYARLTELEGLMKVVDKALEDATDRILKLETRLEGNVA